MAIAQKKLFEKIFRLHRRKLKNLGARNNRRLVVGIAGVPGSGKTFLARAIAHRYKSVRISNDEIRKILSGIDITQYGYGPAD